MTESRTSRWSASFAVALAAHAAVLALLAGSAIVRLDIVPTTIDLTFLHVSDRTAGPGETAPELRTAAPGAEPPAPPEPPREETPPETVPVPPAPAVRLDPGPVAKPKPQPKPAPKEQPPPAVKTPAPPAPSAAAGGAGTARGAAGAAGDAGARGTDVRTSAPAWAASARVRYEQILFAWMDRHKQYPMLAQRRGMEGEGSVRVRIDRDGRVLERTVVRSTGERMLDQAALDMVHRANPFPRVPPEYAGETFEFVAPIQYRLR